MKFILQINRVILLAIIGMGIVLQGCIKDDRSNCLRYGVTIDFIYDYNEDDIDKFKDVVESVDLYIYKKSGDLASQVTLTKADLETSNYQYNARMDEGKYDVVAWMNLTADYEVSDKEKIDKARVSVKPSVIVRDVWEIENGMSNIFHGMVEIEMKTVEPELYTISFIKDTKEIIINAIFDKTLPALDEITMELTSTHGIQDFLNDPVARLDNNTLLYLPTYSETAVAPGQTNTALYTTVQRLWDRDDVNLKIWRNTPSEAPVLLHEVMLTRKIMAIVDYDTNHKLDKKDNFEIDFNFIVKADGSAIITSISIGDWTEVINDGGI